MSEEGNVLEQLSARRLAIVDSTGRERIVLDAGWQDGSAAMLVVGKEGGSVSIGCTAGGNPQIAVRSAAGRDVMTLVVGEDGTALLAMNDSLGYPALRISRAEAEDKLTIEILHAGQTVKTFP